jgi:hypothetical protein
MEMAWEKASLSEHLGFLIHFYSQFFVYSLRMAMEFFWAWKQVLALFGIELAVHLLLTICLCCV